MQSLGQEDPLEEGRATHFSSLAWRIHGQEPGRLWSIESQRVRCNRSNLACTHVLSSLTHLTPIQSLTKLFPLPEHVMLLLSLEQFTVLICLMTISFSCRFVYRGFLHREEFPGPSGRLGIPRWLSGKESPAVLEMQEMWVPPLGWEDPLEKGMATHFGILAWRIPWTEEPGWLYSMGSQIVGHNWAHVCACTCMHTHTHTHTE